MDAHGWAWLAYALYHPWVAFDAFNYLDIDTLDVSEATAAPMRSRLADQNTLYRLVYGEEDDTAPTEDPKIPKGVSYAFVSVRAKTKCFEDRSLQGEELCDLRKPVTLTAAIKYTAFDVEDLPDAVCVVVRSYGHGWVAKETITKLSRRWAEETATHGLSLGYFRANQSMPMSSILPLAEYVSSLDIFAWGKTSKSQLLDVLRSCRILTQLRVQHRGDLFNEWDEATEELLAPLDLELELKTLAIFCYDRFGAFRSPSKMAWATCLRQLSNFHVTTVGTKTLH